MQVNGQVTGEPLMEFNPTRKRDKAAWRQHLPVLSLESSRSAGREAVENLVASRGSMMHGSNIFSLSCSAFAQAIDLLQWQA